MVAYPRLSYRNIPYSKGQVSYPGEVPLVGSRHIEPFLLDLMAEHLPHDLVADVDIIAIEFLCVLNGFVQLIGNGEGELRVKLHASVQVGKLQKEIWIRITLKMWQSPLIGLFDFVQLVDV